MDFNRARINSRPFCLLAIFFPLILWDFLYSSQNHYSMPSPLQKRWLHPDFTRGRISDMCYPFFLMLGRLLFSPSQNFPRRSSSIGRVWEISRDGRAMLKLFAASLFLHNSTKFSFSKITMTKQLDSL